MPRTGKGGARTGTTGTAYAQRTDLNAHLPIETANNQTYGEATAQRAAQGAVPMAPQPVDTAPPAATTTAPLATTAPRPHFAPGSLPFLEPSTRDLPITHGLPFGAGAGPEAMGQSVLPSAPVSSAFAELAQSPNASPAVSSLADTARLLGL